MRPCRWTLWAFALALVPLAISAQQPTAPAQPPAGYAGSGECADCHKPQVAEFAATDKGKLFLQAPRDAHQRLGCEACHGPSKQHSESGGEERGAMIAFNGKHPSPLQARNAACLSCHEKLARTMWQGSVHESRNLACSDCHTVMHTVSERGSLKAPTVIGTCGSCHIQQKNKLTRFSHMPLGEGKMECTSCHNPHGSTAPKLLLASSTNETCFSCHAEKRGPFLWEHAPVVENCSNCHDPHGSSHEKMLKLSRPRLCQECHQGTGHPIIARNPNTATDFQFLFNRQCSNCHVNIHGSNHPSGFAFTR